MGCFAVLLALISPRLAIFVLWLFSDILSRAYEEWIVPFIGFFLLPWTTLAYALMWSYGGNGVHGLEWLIVLFGLFLDLGSYSQGHRARQAR
jgi:hypothetical protein